MTPLTAFLLVVLVLLLLALGFGCWALLKILATVGEWDDNRGYWEDLVEAEATTTTATHQDAA